MTKSIRAIIVWAVLAASVAVFSSGDAADADTYPSRPITIVVPLAAGGPLDTIARIIAEPMRASLGQPIIIENVTGAAGSVGAGRVAHAAPDGLTLGLGFIGTHVFNGALYQLNYDVVKDFEPITLLSSNPHVLVANPALPVTDLKGLIAWLRDHPNKASAGNAGVGSSTHIGAVMFGNLIGVRLALVPYRGAAPALQDVIAGQIELMVDVLSNSLPHVQAGRIRAFAVTAPRRATSAPDIPTVDEAGLPGFYISTWYALFGPKGLPDDIVAKLASAVRAALADPAVQRRCSEVGLAIPPPDQQTPQALAALQRAEIDKWWPIIKAANIKAE
jgi:tripartite-type tricarboxylate transporter receptor subunit TctC